MRLLGLGQALFNTEKLIHSGSHLAPCTCAGTDAGTGKLQVNQSIHGLVGEIRKAHT